MSKKTEEERALAHLDKVAGETVDNTEVNETKKSLGRAKTGQTFGPSLRPGYIKIDLEDLPSKGLFYPEEIKIFHRSADVREVRHFSTINEEDPFEVASALNYILENCLDIRLENQMISWTDLLEEDRLHIVLMVRDLTFPKGENKLQVQINCQSCGHENVMEITSNNFQMMEIDEKMWKYYSEEYRLFNVKTKSFGEITIKPPTIGIMEVVSKYIKENQRNRRKMDSTFLKILPYMVSDRRSLNVKKVRDLEVEYQQWGKDKFGLMLNLVEMVKIGANGILEKKCSKCSEEVTTYLQFPGGIKNLFIISDISGELL